MTDLFSYHLAKQHLEDVRRTAGQTRLVPTGREHHGPTKAGRLITGVGRRISAKFTLPRAGQAPQSTHHRRRRPEVSRDPEGEARVSGGWRRHALRAAAVAVGVFTVAAGAEVARASTPTSPPPLTLLTPHGAVGAAQDIFVSPFGDTNTYTNGAEILSRTGQEIWFHQAPPGEEDADFRAQAYQGRPVLTFWEGTGLGGLSSGTDHIYNDRYRQIATVQAGNGLSADGHEFLITPWNTALILAYTTATANLTSIGGPADQTVINGVVQEIDIATGRVLWQWNSAEHVPYAQSEQPLPSSASIPWDWFHVNAVHLGPHHTVLIDARDTWTAYDVNLRTGQINWQLGGKDSSFTLNAAPGQSLDQAGEIFAWQHDPEYLGHGVFTFFDDESSGAAVFPTSRTVTIRVNPDTHTATLLSANDHPQGLLAPSQGNAQTTAEGNQFVGWGALPYISEFSPTGSLLFNAQFPPGINTYRAYLLPWPARTPSAARQRHQQQSHPRQAARPGRGTHSGHDPART
jgi:hypothetical protein